MAETIVMICKNDPKLHRNDPNTDPDTRAGGEGRCIGHGPEEFTRLHHFRFPRISKFHIKMANEGSIMFL